MSYSVANSHFVAYPPEAHQFVGETDTFKCALCYRPRALHRHDGFERRNLPPTVRMDERVRYGRHPYFFRPGALKLNREEQVEMDRKYGVKGK